MDELPKFNETFMPILEALSNGEVIHHRELIKRIEESYYSELPKELLEQKTKSGDSLLRSRISWGKTYLKKVNLFATRNEEWFKLHRKVKKRVKRK